MDWTLALQLYVAVWVVGTLHELGHLPRTLKLVFWGPFPKLAAMHASFRLGGPLVNVLLAAIIAQTHQTNPWVTAIGLVAFVHILLYTLLGSLLPEPPPHTVDVRTHIFDDFDNRHAGWFLTGALALFLWLWPFYGPLLKAVFA